MLLVGGAAVLEVAAQDMARIAALLDFAAGPGRSDYPLLGQILMRLSDHAAMSAWRPAGRVPHLTLYLPQTLTAGNRTATKPGVPAAQP